MHLTGKSCVLAGQGLIPAATRKLQAHCPPSRQAVQVTGRHEPTGAYDDVCQELNSRYAQASALLQVVVGMRQAQELGDNLKALPQTSTAPASAGKRRWLQRPWWALAGLHCQCCLT